MFPESPTETFNKYAFISKWVEEEKALGNGEGDFSLNYKQLAQTGLAQW